MNAREAAAELAPRLAAAGVADSSFEAEYLVRMATGISRVEYFRGHELRAEQRARLGTLTRRRLEREPAAYIHGEREFHGLMFEVTPAVLLPRPETELLVELAMKECEHLRQPLIVDVGTGSGAIAVAVAHHLPAGTAVGTDVSAGALAVARRNADRHAPRVRFVRGDLLEAFARADVVLANLPYIPTADIAGLEPEVRDWEPRLALDGGEDGLGLVRRLVDDCANRIRPRLLALEVGLGQATRVAEQCRARGAKTEVLNDLAGIERVVCARWA